MRFDVGSGGFIAILLTLAALSGVVFLMGVVAGYDVGRQTALDAQKSAVDYAVAPPASPAAVAAKPRHHGYNITIQAAMDSDSADQMVQRLEELGYHPRRIPTIINGETWYKVQIGPYATADDAAAAEEEMRQRYNSTYDNGRVAAPASSPAPPPEE